MSRTAKDVFQEALQLAETDRAILLDLLDASLQGNDQASIDKAWLDEAERRLGEMDRAEVEMVSWEKVRIMLEARRPKH